MSEFLSIPSKAKVNVNWKVKQYDYSLEQKNNVIAKMSEKLGIPKRHIKVTPIIIKENGEEISVSNEVISSIQKPEFQVKLFKNYLKENKIEDYDFDEILKIDSQINSQIDYKVYDNFCRYSINWVRWSNFLSYGEDNYFDFRQLKNLVLLNGKPGNTSGKTTFAIELVHFLLFGKTDKAKKLADVFNNTLKEVREVTVEGSLTIEGQEYIIKRILTRPDIKKRTANSKVTQKVSYYKVIGDSLEELEDIDNLANDTTTKTNQAIKKVIGDESDFDMIICATSKNLTELVGKTEGERGKLFTKWIGLLPIQEKGEIAKKLYNEVKTTFKSNIYNREELTIRNKENELNIQEIKKTIAKITKENKVIEDELEKIIEYAKELASKKSKIDEALSVIDYNTLVTSIKNEQKRINDLSTQIQDQEKEIENKKIKEDRNTSELNNDYANFTKKKEKLVEKRGELLATYNILSKELEAFKKNGKVCPTCKRPYSDDEYNNYISQKSDEIDKVIKDGKIIKQDIDELDRLIKIITDYNDNERIILQLTIKKGALETQLNKAQVKLAELQLTEVKYNENKKAIDENNKLTIEYNNQKILYKDKSNTLTTNNTIIGEYNHTITTLTNEINSNSAIISEINKEEKTIKNWSIYLDMVGKNGISKMVLRKTLPVINANLQTLLADVCDFSLEVAMNEKNEVLFTMCRDNVKQDLSTCGSGYEATVASLALRAVLGKISTLPKLNFLLLDEIFATVAKENLEKVEDFLRKMLKDFDFVLIISHMEEITNWFDTVITVTKKNGVSSIETVKRDK